MNYSLQAFEELKARVAILRDTVRRLTEERDAARAGGDAAGYARAKAEIIELAQRIIEQLRYCEGTSRHVQNFEQELEAIERSEHTKTEKAK